MDRSLQQPGQQGWGFISVLRAEIDLKAVSPLPPSGTCLCYRFALWRKIVSSPGPVNPNLVSEGHARMTYNLSTKHSAKPHCLHILQGGGYDRADSGKKWKVGGGWLVVWEEPTLVSDVPAHTCPEPPSIPCYLTGG